jgi:putative ABC transport system substrate-binding protein
VRRRDFVKGVAASTTTWSAAVLGQPAAKPPIIGFLGASSLSSINQFVAAFVQRLRELGWIDGDTVSIEYRWAEGSNERMMEIAAEFVRLKVDVIATIGNAAAAIAKQATSSIPIVFAVAGDPVGTGLVNSLAKPGGNITGMSLQQTDTAGKRLELLRELVPNLRRLAIIVNPNNRVSVLESREVQEVTGTLGIAIVPLEVRRADDIATVFVDLKERADAVYITGDPLLTAKRIGINTLAASLRLPAIAIQREGAEAGAVISYGPNFQDLYRHAADYVDKILRGAKPAQLPVEQPTKFDLVLNLTTAKALGLTIPPALLARADEVIE